MSSLQIIDRQVELGHSLVKNYNELSQVAQCSVLGDKAKECISKLRISSIEFRKEFESNDKVLRPPSFTLEKNKYFTSNFVNEVRDAIKKFDELYDILKGRLSKEAKKASTLTLDEFPGASAPSAFSETEISRLNVKDSLETNQPTDSNEAFGFRQNNYTELNRNPGRLQQSDDDFPNDRNGQMDQSSRGVIKNGGLARKFEYILGELDRKVEKAFLRETSLKSVKEKYQLTEEIFMKYVEEFPYDELTENFYLLKERYHAIPGIENEVHSLPFSLPSVEIPMFSGKMIEWDTFRELFEQLIIDQPISNTQKMCILKAKVTGDAARKISMLPVREEYFETAWNMLNEHYSNKRATASIYFRTVIDAPQVTYNSQNVKKFVDTVGESLQALDAMKIGAEEMHQAFLCFLLQRKLDENLRIQFEQHLGKCRDLPKVDTLMEFLKQMLFSLEASHQFFGSSNIQRSWDMGKKRMEPSRYQSQNVKEVHQETNMNQKTQYISTEKCPLGCIVNHLLFRCYKFRNLPIEGRWNFILERNICSRCLNAGHHKRECTSNISCKNCKREHNTILHREKFSHKSATVNNNLNNENTCVLLSTAIVQVKDSKNKWVNCRALLDSGSQVCLVTKAFRNRLNLKGTSTNTELEGLSRHRSLVQERIGVNMRSRTSEYKTNLDVLVIPTILSNVPEMKVVAEKVNDDMVLADPQYNIPNGIDMLIGAEIFFEILLEGKLKRERNILQNSKLGWIVSGPAIRDNCQQKNKIVATTQTQCHELLQKFWEVEEVPQVVKFTAQEKACEKFFDDNLKRTMDGKFEVRLPFKNDSNLLGKSNVIAKRRFFALERKLDRNPELRIQYHDFLQQYLKLGHMEMVEGTEHGYYLPHHCVLRPESSTTKLRVVFDASSKTTTNVSLNDLLHSGPRIQEELFSILIRFRTHRFVFSADIEKMFRQIWVEESDRKFQQIYWRWNANDKIQTYALKTVTYGTASAPYLAVKCLQKIADMEQEEFPLESHVIRNDFYMDDLMTGCNSLQEVIEMRKRISDILLKYGMPLRKWCANNRAIVEGIPESDLEEKLAIENDEGGSVKALGLKWYPGLDVFSLKCQLETGRKFSKRSILSDIAKLFDPLGFVGPVIVSTKILLQELWKQKIDWDENVPNEIAGKWEIIRKEFLNLNMVKVERHMICVNPKTTELIGFCDASMKAYGAVVYLRSIDEEGVVSVRLVASKSRVAPTKVITLPKLELCAAVLLLELMSKIKESLKLSFRNIFYYTDSMIVLSWLQIDPARLQIFVSNRVSRIQNAGDICNWRHVSSEENPADLLSRGLLASKIVKNKFWFEGPGFLKKIELLQKIVDPVNDLPELKKVAKIVVVRRKTFIWEDINHKNKFSYLQNVLAYVLKFINITRKGSPKPFVAYRKESLCLIVKDIQSVHFTDELKALLKGNNVGKSSTLSTLCPILDRQGIIRVGGRLQNSDRPYDAKHPILLPYKNRIVELMVEHIHIEQLHIGPQGLLAIVRQQFWPLRGRQLAKKIVNKCYRCFRTEPRSLHQLMGNLPEDRVIRTRPFLNVGIDFLGPVTIHHKIKGKRTDKAYVCVFVCFVTKAAHLEVVSDLTSAAFIGALKRFVARRGCPLKIYSDNGTNFVGASNSLNEIYHLFKNKEHTDRLDSYCAQRYIEWINIPARSPHIGGLWESCVRSVKKHFYKISEGNMTYEELYTLMTQIESVLNSRPLIPLSDDPNDFNILTPANFLIGENFSTFIDSEVNKCYKGMRGHWRDVQGKIEEFWNQWSTEYLSELQKRYKWKERCSNIQTGTLVLLKEDNLPPLSWRRGRVIRTIMGSDGLCRMIDVRTSNGETRRSVHNVCPFPVDEEDERPVKSVLVTDKENIFNSRKKKNNTIKNKNIFPILIIMLSLVNPIKCQVDVTNFKDKAGVFFEEVATVGLTKSSWNIVVHINITEYTESIAGLDAAMEDINIMVGKQPVVLQLRIFQRLQEAYERLMNRNELIISTATNQRKRRSALPFMGGIFHSLFGLMDEEHAEALSEKIKTNEENEHFLLSHLRNQTSIQDITLHVIKEQNRVISKNMETFRDNFKQIEKTVDILENREATVLQLTNMLDTVESIEETQKDLISAMTQTKGSFIHEILRVKTFKQQINFIKSKISRNLCLPSENLMELAKLAYVSTRPTTEFILFNIRIPLINADRFTAYAVQTYPIFHDGHSIKLQPRNNYVLVDERKAMFYSLKEENFGHCQTLEDLTVCPQIHPIYNTRETKECEILLFLKPSVMPEKCEIEIKMFTNFWKQLHAQNSWIFSLTRGTVTEIKCHGKRQNVIIRGQGLLRMQPGCSLETEEMQLWAYEAYNSDISYILPRFNISTYMPPTNHINLQTEIEVYKIADIPKSNTIFGFPTQLSDHHLTHYGLSLSTWIIITAIIISLICIMKKMYHMSTRYLPTALTIPRLV